MKKFYVYELVIVPDGTVCYVGKGSGRRMWNHRKYAVRPPSDTQSYLYRKLSKLLASGCNFEPHKVFETDDEQVALAEEKRRILDYGLDNLFNCGLHSGSIAASVDAALRAAMSKARRDYVNKLQLETGHKMPPEVAAKISAANKGRVTSPESARKISESKSGVALTSEHRKSLTGVPKIFESEDSKQQRNLKAGASIKQAWDSGRMAGSRGKRVMFKNPEERARRISEANKGKQVSQETRDKIAASLRGRTPVFSDPESRLLKISAGIKRAWTDGRCKSNPVAVEAMRKVNAGKVISAETRQRITEKRRQRIPRLYLITAPNGVVEKRDSYTLSAYCAQHGLSPSNLRRGQSNGHHLTASS